MKIGEVDKTLLGYDKILVSHEYVPSLMVPKTQTLYENYLSFE